MDRWAVRAVPLEGHVTRPRGSLPGLRRDAALLVVGEPPGHPSLAEALVEAGVNASSLAAGARGQGLLERTAGNWEADLLDVDALRGVAARCRTRGRTVGGLLYAAGLGDRAGTVDTLDADDARRRLEEMLAVAQGFDADMRAAAEAGSGIVATVTAMDGRFGLSRCGRVSLPPAALVGFWKSVASEWRVARVKHVDLDPALGPLRVQHAVGELLRRPADTTETGLDPRTRWCIDMVPAARPPTIASLPVDRDSVVLVTGGGRGITAHMLRLLAARTGTRLVLTGRDPCPSQADEPDAVRGIRDVGATRAALLESLRSKDPSVTPRAVETALRDVLRRRELRGVLATLATLSSHVEYHPLDVRDDAALATLIEDVYRRYGRIDGVIHAAGVVDDARIVDKTAAALGRVFDTKVRPALTLARCLRPERLRFLCFFSSASARLGNAGQADYGAANECLNRLATYLDATWPARVMAIAWGPWDGGMLQPALRAAYAARGVALLDKDAGAQAFLEELRIRPPRGNGVASDAEVVLAADLPGLIRAARRRAGAHDGRPPTAGDEPTSPPADPSAGGRP